MTYAIFLIIGILVGIAIFYVVKQDELEKANKLENQLKQVKEELARAEASHEQRLRDATEALKWDYQKLNDQRIAQLIQEHRTEIAKLQGQSQPSIAKVETINQLQDDLWADKPTSQPEVINEPVSGTSEPEIITETEPEVTSLIVEQTESELIHEPVSETSEPEIITETEPEVTSLIVEQTESELIHEPVSETFEPEMITETEPEVTSLIVEQTESELIHEPVSETFELETIAETKPEVISLIVEQTKSQDQVTTPIISEHKADLLTTVQKLVADDSGANIHQLMTYIYEKDDQIRTLVAFGLGKVVAKYGFRKEIQQAIPVLEKLSKDSASSVRKEAIIALGYIKSTQSIKLLEAALRDHDSEVVSCANVALTSLKGYRIAPKIKAVSSKISRKAAQYSHK